MKRLIIFTLLLTIAILFKSMKVTEKEYPYIKIPKDIEEVGEFKNNAFLIKKDGKYGIMRIDTTIAVEPVWDYVDSFNSNGHNIVGKNGKYGVINEHQDILIPIIYDSIKFSSVPNSFIVSQNNKWGVVNWKNNEIIPVSYEGIIETEFEKYIIKENGRYGVANSFGNIIVPIKYIGLSQINKKTYIGVLERGGKYHIIASKNDFTEATTDLSDKYDAILSYCPHMSIVTKDGMDFLMNLNNYKMKILGNNYKVVGDFINRIAVIKDRNRKYGIINEEGTIIVEPKYQYLSIEENDMILFKEGKKYGYMDRMENIIIPAVFKELTPFYKDRAIFKVDGKEGVVDIKGEVVVMPEYLEVVGIKDNVYILRTEEGVGVFDKKGNVIIPPKYYSITFFGKSSLKVLDRGIVRIINYAGKENLRVKASEIRSEWKETGQINLKDRIYIFM